MPTQRSAPKSNAHEGATSGLRPRTESSSEKAKPVRYGLLLGLLVAAQFIVVVDYSIVQIALPTIRNDLLISLADSQWIISAYGLTFAGFLLLSGRLSDMYGRKRIFLAGLVVFSASSLTAGLASSEAVLIFARVVQGVGAALASAAGLALITRIFGPLGRLNQALGVFTAVSSAGFTAGVILGGVLTQELTWRWIFFVNVPIGLVASLLTAKILSDPFESGEPRRRLDLPGAVSVTGGLMLLVYGLSELGNGDPTLLTYASFVGAGAALASFVMIERRSIAPVLPLGFLKRSMIFVSNAAALLTFATVVPMIFLLATYLQVIEGYSPINAALGLVPGSLVFFFLGGFGAPRLVARFGSKKIIGTAMATLSVGMLLMSWFATGSGYVTTIMPALVVAALGGAMSLTATNIAALSGAARGEEGVASGLINTSRQVGGPIGLALVISVMGAFTNGQGLASGGSQLIEAFRYAFAASAGFAALAAFSSLLLRPNPVMRVEAESEIEVPEVAETPIIE